MKNFKMIFASSLITLCLGVFIGWLIFRPTLEDRLIIKDYYNLIETHNNLVDTYNSLLDKIEEEGIKLTNK